MSNEAFAGPDFKALFESAPGAFVVLDPKLHIVGVSDAYLQATRTRRADILGRYLFDVFPDNPGDPSSDGIRNTRASLQRVLQSREADAMVIQRHDVRRPESEGGGFEVRYWSPFNAPVLNPDGSLAYIIHRVENVTDFVLLKQQGVEQSKRTDALREQALQTEAELYALSREVAESSIKLKLANEELARLYEKTRELDVLKSHFFANVSHELRTPLTLILGPVDRLLKSENLDEEARNNLLVVRHSARLLKRHVNDLLDIARLEAGHMLIQYGRTDLAMLTRLAASHFEILAADRNIRSVVQTPAALPAEVDGEKVERMLINLLSNAFKFTPDGGAVSLTLEERSGRALIRVQDNGPGVPESLREAIFERFRQGEDATERRHGGTGLGLAIVREFAILHGGTAGVTEAPGGGALFTLDLPLAAPAGTPVAAEAAATRDTEAASQAVDELQRHPAPSPFGPAPADAQTSRVLVVEDNPDMNAFLADALGRHYWITRAFDGLDGLKKALADPPDLILSDIMMPGMSGDRMVEELRRHNVLDDVPIVMLTAKADDALRARLLHHGVQDYIHKPFSEEELLARVGGLLAQRQRTGRRLRQSEERFRRLVKMAPIPLCFVNRDGELSYCNDRFIEVFGYTPDEVPTLREWWQLAYPEERYRRWVVETWEAAVRRAAETNADIEPIEYAVTCKSGTVRHVVISGITIEDNFLATFIDITERKGAEEAARQASEQRRLALEAAELGAWDYHFDTGEVFWDERCASMFGVPAGEISDADAMARIRPDDQVAVREALAQALAGVDGGAYHCEFRVVWPDGSEHWIASHGRAYFSGDGEHRRAVRFVGVNLDISGRKQAEKRLLEAQKLESLGLLAGGVAHDFNNLLVGVIGNASLAQEMIPPDHPAAELLHGVLKTGEQAAHLTRQMLAYAGKGKFVVEPLVLSALIPEMSGLVRPSISKKTALRLDLDPDLPPIEADRGQIQQVFMNLVLNAAEAIGSHDGLITVGTGVQDVDERYMQLHPETAALPRGKYVCLEVRDTGCGMDEKTKARIFDPFFSTKFLGRGLGLAAVAGILRGHKGAIFVSSTPGKGSCFTVLFPPAPEAGQPPVAARRTALQGAGAVLVVDDEPVVREMAKRALERYGYTVLLADSGLAAIDVCRRHPGEIALVVLDLSMPHMSGEEALPELRKIRPEVKVVVSSGYSESEAMTLFQGQRVSGFIQKPYTSNGLAEKVKVCVG